MNPAAPTPPAPDNGPRDFAAWMQARRAQVEAALEQSLAPALWPAAVAPLVQAMRYGALGGGKRLRALLTLAAHEALCTLADIPSAQRSAWAQTAIRAACAVELIHAYSLIHDDMPCMDNDVLRRGKPTVHVQFGEATALLAGDAMQALAFEWLTPPTDTTPTETALPPAQQWAAQARLCSLLARAAGPSGMAGGQAIDLAHVGLAMNQAQLQHMHELKTGALLLASVQMGAACAPSASPAIGQALHQYGQALGLAFQVVDDVLDATADSATLGKTAGKDAADNKPTYVSIMGVQAARAYADELHARACAALEAAPALAASPLRGLADLVVQRAH